MSKNRHLWRGYENTFRNRRCNLSLNEKDILYRSKGKTVAASPTRGRGRVRIKSRDQHPRDLATLGPEIPLGHPTVRTSPCVNIQVARHDAMLGAT